MNVLTQFIRDMSFENALAQLYDTYDSEHGGFGGAPKFPSGTGASRSCSDRYQADLAMQNPTH